LPLSAWAIDMVERPGWGSVAGVFGLLLADLLVPVPSSAIMILSGAMFGVAGGAALSLAGSLAGNFLGFELSRRYGRSVALRLVSARDLERAHDVFMRTGVAAIAISRPLPVVMETLSVAAGLASMSRAQFLAASLVGTAPVAVLYACAGAWSLEAGTLLPAVIMLVAVLAGGWSLYWSRAR
jgi:uncharacterized membrane protein YdjX (TVP38/TMEM64 family)